MTTEPIAPDEEIRALLPRARKIAERAGEVPSQRALKTALKVGAPKAKTVREALLAEVPEVHPEDRPADQPAAPGWTVPGAPGPHPGLRLVGTPGDAPETISETAPRVHPEVRPDTVPERTQEHTPENAPVPDVPQVSPPVGAPGNGRLIATVAFVVGIAASIAANTAHTFVPPAGSGSTWGPSMGAVVAGAFWPVALLLAVETLSRVRWAPGRTYWAARYLGTGAVSAVAAIMSYRHMAALLAWYGEDSFSAHLGPLAVDGLMVVAGFALLGLSRHRKN